ncbi:AAA family ATPase [Nocardia sp. KC 131]|uniref:AAA family ATPase n=1 Tax=Nocardia arseniciresistens TaxID=3392119 RepID=UPI00398EC8C9
MSVPKSRGVTRGLVGRVEEMRTLTESLAAVRSGGTAAVSVTGEPGIGKTRLIQEVCAEAASMGFGVLHGRGSELEREIPYAAVVDALDRMLGSLRRSELRMLSDEGRSELGRLLPSLGDWAGPLAAPLQVERHGCHRAVRLALDLLAVRRPLLLVLDDVHWADHASIEVIAYLLRNTVPRMMVLLAHRPRRTPTIFATALARATSDGTLTTIGLGPLSHAQVAELLHDHVAGPELDELHRECGGNPFYLQELARVSYRGGQGLALMRTAASDRAGIPATVLAALEHEVRALSPAAQSLLRSAAVAGDPFDLDLAAEIAELEATEVHSAVDELIREDLVRDSDAPGRLVFRHPIVRYAIYDGAGYSWRRLAHGRAAAAQATRRAGLSVRAHHLEQCADVGDVEAATLLAEAGRAAAARAPVAAARWFEAALRLLPDDDPSERRVSLSLDLAEALTTTGRLGDGNAALRRALDLLPAAAARDRRRITAMIVRIEQGLGNASEARRLLSAALAQPCPDGAEWAELQLLLAKNHMMMRDWAEAARTAADVRAIARRDNDRRLSLVATATSAYLGQMPANSLACALADLDEAAPALDALSDDDVAPGLLDALTKVVHAEVCFERWDAVVEHADRGIRLSRATGHGGQLVEIMHLRVVALIVLGRLDDALCAIDSATETALLLGNEPMLALSEADRCWVLGLLGRTEAALAAGARGVAVCEHTPHAPSAWFARMLYGSVLIDAGQYRRGRHEIISAGGGVELSGIFPVTRPRYHRYLVDAELALGRIDAAEDSTRRIEKIARTVPMLHTRVGDAHYARARVLLAREEVQAAMRSAEHAVAEYESSRSHLEVAQARLVLGEALLDADVAAARREFDSAYTVFDSCGAARLADRARLALQQVGRSRPGTWRRSHAAVGALGDLTERQADIVNRVVLGKTNRLIAAELRLSEKTVEAHLARLFAKTGVSSRAELAALAMSRTNTKR